MNHPGISDFYCLRDLLEKSDVLTLSNCDAETVYCYDPKLVRYFTIYKMSDHLMIIQHAGPPHSWPNPILLNRTRVFFADPNFEANFVGVFNGT